MGSGRKHSKPSARKGKKRGDFRVQAKLRAQEALDLKIQGKNYVEIAKELGYAGRQGAFEAVKSELQKQSAEKVSELRKINSARLDKVIEAHLPLATEKHTITRVMWGKPVKLDVEPSTFSGKLVVDAIHESNALNGLNKPVKSKIEHSGEVKQPAAGPHEQLLHRIASLCAGAAPGAGAGEADRKPDGGGG